MKFLLAAKQEKNAAAFLDTLRSLIDRGHSVTLAVQEWNEERDRRLARQIDSDRFAVVPCPSARSDEWSRVAPVVRRLRDCVHYLRPPFDGFGALQTRIFHKLRQELGLDIDADVLAGAFRLLRPPQRDDVESILRLAEASLPTSALLDEFVRTQQPDVLLISPLVHFGSAQADVAASGRRLGIPVWMLLFSWDNLSTKGCMHVEPDLMFVWNEQQRREAERLHGFPPSRVIVVGAPRFDSFFRLQPAMTREQFHEPLGLDAARPTLLYLCSSRLIAPRELAFVQRWIEAVRASGSRALQDCNIVVRPHPDIGLLPDSMPLTRHRWPAAPSLDAHMARPFQDPRTIVLRTSFKDPDGLYESLVHSTAVVGLNTTAELEAGIVGRPVFTIASDDGDDGQQMTLHFHYLTREHGGFVSAAQNIEQHVAQLDAELTAGADTGAIRTFIESFVRPHGLERPVSSVLAEALEEAAANPPARRRAVSPRRAAVVATPASPAPDVLPLAYHAARIVVHAGPETMRHVRNGAVSLDRSIVRWLKKSVKIGDVVYDVNAGFGAYAIIAAKQRGAVVVAFEPGYKMYHALCDNLALNGCHGVVVPVPLAISDRDRVAHLKYHRGFPGEERYVVQPDAWRVRPPEAVRPDIQSVCAASLDAVAGRYGLPPATHLRLSRHVAVGAVLDGATRTIAQPSLRSIWLRIPHDDEAAVVERLGGVGLHVAVRGVGSNGVQLVFTREPAGTATVAGAAT